MAFPRVYSSGVAYGPMHLPVARVTVHRYRSWDTRRYQRGIFGPVLGSVLVDPDDEYAVWAAPSFGDVRVFPPFGSPPIHTELLVACWGPPTATGARGSTWGWRGPFTITPGDSIRVGPLPLEVFLT